MIDLALIDTENTEGCYTEVKMILVLTSILLFNNAVIASECNERSNLPSTDSTFSMFLAVFQAIIEFSAKKGRLPLRLGRLLRSLLSLAMTAVYLKNHPKTTFTLVYSQSKLKTSMRFIIGPELFWLILYIIATIIAKDNAPPTKAMDDFIESSWYWIPLISTLIFALWYIPVVEKKRVIASGLDSGFGRRSFRS